MQYNQLKELVPLKEPSEVFMERKLKEEKEMEYLRVHKMTLLKKDRDVQLAELSLWRDDFYDKKEKAFNKAKEIAEKEAENKSILPEMNEKYKKAAPLIRKDFANGKFTNGVKKHISLQEAENEAKKIFKSKYIESFMRSVEKDWKNRELENEKKEEEEREKLINEWNEEDKDFDYKQEIEEAKQKAIAKQKRIEKTKDIKIINYNKAIPLKVKCEHLVLRCWKTITESGIRCSNCNKSLTYYYNDISQQLGGYDEDDVILHETIEAHRKTNGSISIKDSNYLELVEKTRLQMEKERREVELAENSFSDEIVEDVVYHTGSLHRIPLPKTPDDLVFRKQDIQHKAKFHSLTSKYIRISQYNHTIKIIKDNCNEISYQKIDLNQKLFKLHKHLITIFDRINAVEQEYCRAGDLLNEKKKAYIRVSELEYEIIRSRRLLEAANRRLRVYDTKRRDYQRAVITQQELITELLKMNEVQQERLIISDVFYYIYFSNF